MWCGVLAAGILGSLNHTQRQPPASPQRADSLGWCHLTQTQPSSPAPSQSLATSVPCCRLHSPLLGPRPRLDSRQILLLQRPLLNVHRQQAPPVPYHARCLRYSAKHTFQPASSCWPGGFLSTGTGSGPSVAQSRCLVQLLKGEMSAIFFLLSSLLNYLLSLLLPALKFHSISFFHLTWLFNTTSVLLGLKSKRSPEQINASFRDRALELEPWAFRTKQKSG